jgi:hypothetical protein
MTTLVELRELVARRRDELARLDARIDPIPLLDEVLAALREIAEPVEPLFTLRDAAAQCGFSEDHLGRLIREGRLRNWGRRHAPRVRLAECPRRAVASTPQPVRDIAARRSGRTTA